MELDHGLAHDFTYDILRLFNQNFHVISIRGCRQMRWDGSIDLTFAVSNIFTSVGCLP